MKALLVAWSIVGVATFLSGQARRQPEEHALVHVRASFEFTIAAPLREASPLFGPKGERGWSGEDWDPQFLYPQPGKDTQGSVFTVQHATHTSVWVNTVFDLETGQFQYVYFIPEVMVTMIDVRLKAIDPANTQVEVVYTRTALTTQANQHVLALQEQDRSSGKHWQDAIRKYLERVKSKSPEF